MTWRHVTAPRSCSTSREVEGRLMAVRQIHRHDNLREHHRSPLSCSLLSRGPRRGMVGGIPLTLRHACAEANSGTREPGGKCDTAPSAYGVTICWETLQTQQGEEDRAEGAASWAQHAEADRWHDQGSRHKGHAGGEGRHGTHQASRQSMSAGSRQAQDQDMDDEEQIDEDDEEEEGTRGSRGASRKTRSARATEAVGAMISGTVSR